MNEKMTSLSNALWHSKDSKSIVALWNKYLSEKEKNGALDKYDCYIKDMENLEEDMKDVLYHHSFFDIINAIDSDKFKVYDRYWYENKFNRFISFNLLNDYFCPIDFDNLAIYLVQNNPDFFEKYSMEIVTEFLDIYTNEDSFDKYLALINEHIAKKRFITEDWDTLWKEISQLS